jgi:hypothetical protein
LQRKRKKEFFDSRKTAQDVRWEEVPRKHAGEGSDMHSETKIFYLETHEFGSNPPFKKKQPVILISCSKTRGNSSVFFNQLAGNVSISFTGLEL